MLMLTDNRSRTLTDALRRRQPPTTSMSIPEAAVPIAQRSADPRFAAGVGPVISRAVVPTQVERLTSTMIERAMGALGGNRHNRRHSAIGYLAPHHLRTGANWPPAHDKPCTRSREQAPISESRLSGAMNAVEPVSNHGEYHFTDLRGYHGKEAVVEPLTDNTDLKSRYAAQVSADLERNAKEQQRIRDEMEALHEQLQVLESNHALLLSMQNTLANESAADSAQPDRPAAQPSVTLPKARRAEDSAGATGRGKVKVTRSAKGKPQPARAAGGPTLRSLVSEYLTQHRKPCSAAEVTAALAQAHPDRTIRGPVVRGTLESLVAKGDAHRTKQQKSVFYSSAAPKHAVDEAEQDQAATS